MEYIRKRHALDLDQVSGKLKSVLHGYLSCIIWQIGSRSSTEGGADIADVQRCPATVSEELKLMKLRGLKVCKFSLLIFLVTG